ncbi:MAG TPA: hypothetical protein VF152_12135 [Acidimicrobiia bacterium]
MALTGPEADTARGPAHLGVPVARAQLGGSVIEIVESRTTRWLFDRDRRRMLRLPREVDLDVGVLALPWQPYTAVRLDDDGTGVVVTLAGGGLLRLGAVESPSPSG